jgi:hypothetical protein
MPSRVEAGLENSKNLASNPRKGCHAMKVVGVPKLLKFRG